MAAVATIAAISSYAVTKCIKQRNSGRGMDEADVEMVRELKNITESSTKISDEIAKMNKTDEPISPKKANREDSKACSSLLLRDRTWDYLSEI